MFMCTTTPTKCGTLETIQMSTKSSVEPPCEILLQWFHDLHLKQHPTFLSSAPQVRRHGGHRHRCLLESVASLWEIYCLFHVPCSQAQHLLFSRNFRFYSCMSSHADAWLNVTPQNLASLQNVDFLEFPRIARLCYSQGHRNNCKDVPKTFIQCLCLRWKCAVPATTAWPRCNIALRDSFS